MECDKRKGQYIIALINMDEFHKHNVEWKRPDRQGYIVWNPIHITKPSETNLCCQKLRKCLFLKSGVWGVFSEKTANTLILWFECWLYGYVHFVKTPWAVQWKDVPSSSPGQAAQFAGASYAKVMGLIPSQSTYKNQPINASISGRTNWCFSPSLSQKIK